LIGHFSRTTIEAIKSPYGNNERIVAIPLKDADAFDPFLTALLNKQQFREISGSVSVLEGAQLGSFGIGAAVYLVGVLPWRIHLDLWFIPCRSRDSNSIGSMCFFGLV
jgi:hypothetical protein